MRVCGGVHPGDTENSRRDDKSPGSSLSTFDVFEKTAQ